VAATTSICSTTASSPPGAADGLDGACGGDDLDLRELAIRLRTWRRWCSRRRPRGRMAPTSLRWRETGCRWPQQCWEKRENPMNEGGGSGDCILQQLLRQLLELQQCSSFPHFEDSAGYAAPAGVGLSLHRTGASQQDQQAGAA
jgi:hypothetical protein